MIRQTDFTEQFKLPVNNTPVSEAASVLTEMSHLEYQGADESNSTKCLRVSAY